ncbi:MAG: SusC/RagA family TonB-linked outer membrane protein [Porphyromonas sp.]|nr:SusC/RagA family TonB-linked outer membrane protein [Porphyromonas sp.]
MKKFMLLLTVLLISVGSVLAQMKEVSGVVLNQKDNQPINRATVKAKSGKGGAYTDAQGRFRFKVPEAEKMLVVSLVGMKTVEIPVGTNLKIVLKEEASQLDDVVVTGYSSATKRSFTGSATVVNTEALEKKSVSNVSQALAGEVPGVNVINSSGQPGSSASIDIRGVASVNAGTSPLIVVDGVPFMGAMASLNPADIESTTLLKDAASTSIYGARGAHGVIVVTTKRGAVGKIGVSADVKYGVNTIWIPRHSVITSPDEYLELGWSGIYTRGLYDPALTKTLGAIGSPEREQAARQYAMDNLFGAQGIAPKYNYFAIQDDLSKNIDPNTGKVLPNAARRYTPERWADHAFQASSRTEANVQISGGTQNLRAFTSVGYLNDKGISRQSDFQRFSGRTNVEFRPVSWLNTKANLSLAKSKTNAAGQSSASSANLFYYIDNMPPIYPVFARDEKGNVIPSRYYKGLNEYDYGEGRGFQGMANALGNAYFNIDRSERLHIDYNANATLNLFDGLTFENTLSGTFVNTFSISTESPFYGSATNVYGTLYHGIGQSESVNALSLLRYRKNFGGNHNLEAFLAHEAYRFTTQSRAIEKKGFVDPFDTSLSNALEMSRPATGTKDVYAIESFFGQANYDYQGKYFASGTLRRDGSSRFANNKWGTFGSVGLAWVLTGEEFLKENSTLNFLKLKASYGTLGQQDGISYYSGFDSYAIRILEGKPSLLFDGKGNPDLTWERSSMFQVGFEAELFKRLIINAEFYIKNSSDLIYERRVAPSNGYAIYTVNDGLLRNTGLDIDLTAKILQGPDYFFNIRANAGFLSNKMIRMAIEPSTGQPKYIDESISMYGRMANRSLYDYYMRDFVGVNPDNGVAQYRLFYVDNNKDNKFNEGDEAIASLESFYHKNKDKRDLVREGVTETYSDATRLYVGKSALPTVRGGFTLLGGFKGFDLSAQFIYGLGGYGYDSVYAGLMHNRGVGKQNWHIDIRNRWTAKGQQTDVPRLSNELDVNVDSPSSRFLTSNSFLHLANVRLGYTLPKTWVSGMKLSGVNVWVSGDNLYIMTARRGYNPTTSRTGGSSSYRYDPLTTLTAGLRVTF